MSQKPTERYQSIGLEDFHAHFGGLIELSSEALGSSIVSVSDEWFAPASSLLKVNPAQSFPGQFGPNGALYDGWESRRHNSRPTGDWVVIRLGVSSATVSGFDVDTTHFSGNEGPACRVFAFPSGPEADSVSPTGPSPDDPLWQEILPTVPLGPSSRHLFKIPKTSQTYQYVKLHMIPDGGIARFRVYGHPIPVFPADLTTQFDLASVLLGAQVVLTSNQHYGVGSNLILPGRGPASMDGGWETRRSRTPGHSDHVIIKLSTKGYLFYTEVDTNYFIGNFPQQVDFYGTESDQLIPGTDANWQQILPKTKLGPHQQQYFQLTKPELALTHVKMTIYPDGGIKRVRLVGCRTPTASPPATLPSPNAFAEISVPHLCICPTKPKIKIPVLPLTRAGFAPFGSTIEAYDDSRTWPPSIRHKTVNFGSAEKYNNVAQLVTITTPNGLQPAPNFCVFSCKPWPRTDDNKWALKGLERHPYSSQSFVPLGAGTGRYLVVVGLDNGTGKPDLGNLRGFMAQVGQGISYEPNVWHAPLIAVDQSMDFACVVYETGVAEFDCELVECDQEVVCEMVTDI
ncbi:hypothetical protein CROQUDRAFT_36949 [Cronartium quercuum f. sp. fusiforme G11]|uniref:Allantoicase domain-containing protein n=1 Tax=Cronartium quercuum f. sp. fusiforme G11 TaxID=708437 RepID=A0A9P6NTG7_9BASI|nr:hypothetical protein CROQUDRAFT_36949 [Cronartium quercuum f. sp. fusiforme G11]